MAAALGSKDTKSDFKKNGNYAPFNGEATPKLHFSADTK